MPSGARALAEEIESPLGARHGAPIFVTASLTRRFARENIVRSTLSHAHTVSVDPRTHRVYLPLENVDGRPVLRILIPTS